jgi:hypothetical protein
MNGMSDLHLDWCGYEAAKYAVMNWHYSETMPTGKLIKIGVWEGGDFIGCVIYSRGGAPNIAEPYGMDQTEVCELTRVALDDHETPVTRILSISRKLLTSKCPGLRLVVSYADPEQDHTGGIYQADNWIYTHQLDGRDYIKIGSDVKHPRSCNATYGTSSIPKLKQQFGEANVTRVPVEGKHKYLYPLDNEIRQKLEAISKPYP